MTTEVARNHGIAVWVRRRWCECTISNNRIHHNDWQGMNFEISPGRAFTTTPSGRTAGRPLGVGAGIVISSSANAQVYSNTLPGISVVSRRMQNRRIPRPNAGHNYVHDQYHRQATITGDFSQHLLGQPFACLDG